MSGPTAAARTGRRPSACHLGSPAKRPLLPRYRHDCSPSRFATAVIGPHPAHIASPGRTQCVGHGHDRAGGHCRDLLRGPLGHGPIGGHGAGVPVCHAHANDVGGGHGRRCIGRHQPCFGGFRPGACAEFAAACPADRPGRGAGLQRHLRAMGPGFLCAAWRPRCRAGRSRALWPGAVCRCSTGVAFEHAGLDLARHRQYARAIGGPGGHSGIANRAGRPAVAGGWAGTGPRHGGCGTGPHRGHCGWRGVFLLVPGQRARSFDAQTARFSDAVEPIHRHPQSRCHGLPVSRAIGAGHPDLHRLAGATGHRSAGRLRHWSTA